MREGVGKGELKFTLQRLRGAGSDYQEYEFGKAEERATEITEGCAIRL